MENINRLSSQPRCVLPGVKGVTGPPGAAASSSNSLSGSRSPGQLPQKFYLPHGKPWPCLGSETGRVPCQPPRLCVGPHAEHPCRAPLCCHAWTRTHGCVAPSRAGGRDGTSCFKTTKSYRSRDPGWHGVTVRVNSTAPRESSRSSPTIMPAFHSSLSTHASIGTASTKLCEPLSWHLFIFRLFDNLQGTPQEVGYCLAEPMAGDERGSEGLRSAASSSSRGRASSTDPSRSSIPAGSRCEPWILGAVRMQHRCSSRVSAYSWLCWSHSPLGGRAVIFV